MDIPTLIRALPFVLILVIMILWEWALPRRRRDGPLLVRWFSNLGVGTLNVLLLSLLLPMLGFALSVVALKNGWGLFNMIDLPALPVFLASLVLLDLIIWAQHRLFHWQPQLWRLHRMHHADIDLDTTTGVRFHPLEAILSSLIKAAAIVILGIPPLAYLAFEVILSSMSLFNHGNVRLPVALDRWLRLIMVTPDMHRVHHSVVAQEMNSNFGFNLPWWDRLFGTYQAQPEAGHQGMQIGLPEFRSRTDSRLDKMLVQPLR